MLQLVSGAYLNRKLHQYIGRVEGDIEYGYYGYTGDDGVTHITPDIQYHLPKKCIVELNGVRITMPPDIYIDVDFDYQSIDFSEWDSDTIVHIPFNKLYSFEIIK